jgi:phosphoribosylanthranilate isomerase
LAVELGADLIGLNFYRPSPRYVDLEQARRIAQAVRGRAGLVGVFVNEVRAGEIAEQVGLDLLQFHGDEGPEDLSPFGRRAIKVLRVQESFDPASLAPYPEVWGFLVDSQHPSLYGGSGCSWNFETLDHGRPDQPIYIAGGLGPDNVRAVLKAANPYGIDICSGVESAPGRKDSELMRRLFEEIQHGEIP